MRSIRPVLGVLFFCLALAPLAQAHETLSFPKIEAALERGAIDSQEALLAKFRQVFAPEAMQPELRDDSFGMVRCATPLMVEWERTRAELRPEVDRAIDGLIAPSVEVREKRATYLSPLGYFEFTYTVGGLNGVSGTDVSPANGVPDYVERCAEYMDYSWDFECNTLGFPAPPIGGSRYQVAFESMGAYGYTTTAGSPPGGTRIVLHNTFVGFPPNTDPDGQVLGAAKVTAAHEFKHASQFAGSNWSEGGWVELDATWMEDIAYDDTNDFYNYLPSGSPISAPSTSLDAGGTGSYEDCVWQAFMSQVHGNQIIVDLQTWRNSNQGQSMMASYDQLLSDYGSSLADAWPLFAGWNYATGTRANAGFSYDEASAFPTSPLAGTRNTYPAYVTGSLPKLSAAFVRATDFDNASTGTVDVTFMRNENAQVELSAVVHKTDGSYVFERLSFPSVGGNASLATPLEEIVDVGFIVSNSQTFVSSEVWTLEIVENVFVPTPNAAISETNVAVSLFADEQTTVSFILGNDGETGSTLNYDLYLMNEEITVLPKQAAKSVAGSTVSPDVDTYVPGTTGNYVFTVVNQSTDEEWLTDVTLQFPAGVTVNSSTNFVGGAAGPLVTDGSTGDGALVSWTDTNGSYGNIYGNGQSATATLNLSFDAGLGGPLSVGYFIQGDIWGATPHSVSGTITLDLPPQDLTLTGPSGAFLAVDDVIDIEWTSEGLIDDVKIEWATDGGIVWNPLFASTPNDGSESWTVTGPLSDVVLFRVSTLDDAVVSTSETVNRVYVRSPWLSGTVLTGSVAEGGNQVLSFDVDTTGMSPGLYAAIVAIVHDGPTSPDYVVVDLHVKGPTAAPAALPFALSENVPNPFNPATKIHFSLAQAGAARLAVYDLAGRLVDVLVDGPLAEGQHEVVWRGTDLDGRGVASGVYLYRLSTERGEEQVRRMVLVR